MIQREGRVFASKDFPNDPVEVESFESFVQVLSDSGHMRICMLAFFELTFERLNLVGHGDFRRCRVGGSKSPQQIPQGAHACLRASLPR